MKYPLDRAPYVQHTAIIFATHDELAKFSEFNVVYISEIMFHI